MAHSRPVYLAGTGAYLPGEPIPFERSGEVLGELTEAPPKIRRWIATTAPVLRELLDISYVHYAIDPVTRAFTDDNVTMATKAAGAALEAAGIAPQQLDLICYGSAHQDQMPTASVRIQEALGIESCAEFSIHANCTSAYKALHLAHRLLAAGDYRTALVVSASISSSELRAEYYNQALVDKESLFLRWFLCDGAGALVLTTDRKRGQLCLQQEDRSVPFSLEVEQTYIESVGGRRPSLMFNRRPAFWMNPRQEFEEARHHLRQNFRNALSTGVFQEEGGSVFLHGLQRMLARTAIDPATIRFFQVNLPARHIVDSVLAECAAIGIRREAFAAHLAELGYCGPPMAFIGLDRIVRSERLAPGERILSFVTEVSKFMQAGYAVRCLT